MKVITFSNGKGGVGKTTLCVNVAVTLARMGKRVVVIDCDRQAQACLSLGVDRGDGFYELMTGKRFGKRDRVELDGISFVEARSNLFVLPSSELAEEAEFELVQNHLDDGLMKRILNGQSLHFRQRSSVLDGADYVLIDTPSQGLRSRMALRAADLIVAPVMPRGVDGDGLSLFASSVVGLEITAPVIIAINAMDRRTKRSEEMSSHLRNLFLEAQKESDALSAWQFCPVALPLAVEIDRCAVAGVAYVEKFPRSPFALAIQTLTGMVVGALSFEGGAK